MKKGTLEHLAKVSCSIACFNDITIKCITQAKKTIIFDFKFDKVDYVSKIEGENDKMKLCVDRESLLHVRTKNDC